MQTEETETNDPAHPAESSRPGGRTTHTGQVPGTRDCSWRCSCDFQCRREDKQAMCVGRFVPGQNALINNASICHCEDLLVSNSYSPDSRGPVVRHVSPDTSGARTHDHPRCHPPTQKTSVSHIHSLCAVLFDVLSLSVCHTVWPKHQLSQSKVLFGCLRFSFGVEGGSSIVKHVFFHWVGTQVPVVLKGKLNAQKGLVEAFNV